MANRSEEGSVFKKGRKWYAAAALFIFASFAPLLSSFAQQSFKLSAASKYFDVEVVVAKCERGFCEGPATFSFLKKGSTKPFQVIKLEDTQIWLDKSGNAPSNYTLLYDEQSVVNVDDFNFDGQDDIAICDGHKGSYGMPSYRVYLSQHGRFVYNAAFSQLGQINLGMFSVDHKSKTLETLNKSGCCYHITKRYSVVNNRPLQTFENTNELTPDGVRIITTRKRIGGKWRTWVKHERG